MPPRKKRPISVAVVGPNAAGRYEAWLQVGIKANGKPDRRHRSGKTPEDVEDKIRVLEDQLAADAVTQPGLPPTVAEWLTHWLDTIVAPRRKYKTTAGYRSAVNCHLIPLLGAHRLDKLQPMHIDAMYIQMAKQGAKPGTVHQAYRTLRTALGVVAKREKGFTNAAAIAGPPAWEEPEAQSLSVAEARRVIDVCRTWPTGTRWLVALALGLRQGEVLGLPWPNIDLDAGTIRIQRKAYRRAWQHGCKNPHACAVRHCRTTPCSKIWEHGCSDGQPCGYRSAHRCPDRRRGTRCPRHQRPTCPPPCRPDCTGHAKCCPERVGGGIAFDGPKSERGKRTTSMPEPLMAALRVHKARQREQKMAARDRWVEHDLVFCGPTGRPIDARRDWQDWQDLLEATGLPRMGVHAARHTAATLLLVMGVAPRVVMDIMGWSQESMLKRYQHVVDELRDEAARRMGTVLWSEDGGRPASMGGAGRQG